jgi:hypothetical protein
MKLRLLPLTADRRRFLLTHPYRIAVGEHGTDQNGVKISERTFQ